MASNTDRIERKALLHAQALEGNAKGWEAQLMLIGKHLARAA